MNIILRRDDEIFDHKVTLIILTRKSSMQGLELTVPKPTQVGEMSILRRLDELRLRNSAN